MSNIKAQKPSVGVKVTDSSFIEYLGYNRRARLLFVGMGDGTTIYEDVDEDLYANFVTAESKGTFLNKAIKSRNFNYETVSETFTASPLVTFSEAKIAEWRAAINAYPVVAL